jgi:tyrosyl-tRNA synthetase
MKNFIEELKWRGMFHQSTSKVDDIFKDDKIIKAYIGFDPTSDSLGIGNLAQIMTLLHFQKCGHKPIVLIGGATGMVGDPSGKSKERNLLAKVAGKEIVQVEEVEKPAMDIMTALKASIEKAAAMRGGMIPAKGEKKEKAQAKDKAEGKEKAAKAVKTRKTKAG